MAADEEKSKKINFVPDISHFDKKEEKPESHKEDITRMWRPPNIWNIDNSKVKHDVWRLNVDPTIC